MKEIADSGVQAGRIIITAGKGGGKTAAVRRIVAYLRSVGFPYTGFYAEGTWEGDMRGSFTLRCVPGGVTVPFCDRATSGWIPYGRFRYNPGAIKAGEDAVRSALPGVCIVMDEISVQELRGHVWADTLSWAVQRRENPLVLAVQRRCLGDVIAAWKLEDAVVFDGEKAPLDSQWESIARWIDGVRHTAQHLP
ncbi:MAG TPA: nucleoside-triphosphatase [Spirochaetota bacterium]|nr:nucleoside-triphosphatase [Spirochaetota bacterium]